MTEQNRQTSASESWQEVGQQFRVLGENLAAAFKAAYESEETRQHLAGVKTSLEVIAEELKRATQNIAASEEVQKVKEDVKKAAESAKTGGRQTAEEWRPHLISALHAVKTELDQLINRIEESDSAANPPDSK